MTDEKSLDERTILEKVRDIMAKTPNSRFAKGEDIIPFRVETTEKLCRGEFEKELEKHYVDEKTALKDAKEFDRRIKEDKQKAFSEGFAKAKSSIIEIINQKIEKLKKEACDAYGVKSIDSIHESVYKDIIRVLQQLLEEIGDK